MVSPRLLAVAVLALCPILTGALPEPLIFYNLTIEEFHAKRVAYRKRSVGDSVGDRVGANTDHNASTEHFAHLSKRVPIGREDRNNADQQAVVELRSESCLRRFHDEHRAQSGSCILTRPRQMNINCQKPGTGRASHYGAGQAPRKKATEVCPQRTKCDILRVFNYLGNEVNMPYCADIMQIDRRQKDVEAVPTYEGQQNIPAVWDKETRDTFWRIHGEFEAALTGNFDFRGHDKSGKTFRAQSPNNVNSWCCMDCPSGTLYASTIGFKSQAFGFTVPSTYL